MAQPILTYSLLASIGGSSQRLPVTGTSIQTALINSNTVVITPTVDCFFRKGDNPISVADVDQFLLANNSYRVALGENQIKLAFISNGTSGNVYVTPGA